MRILEEIVVALAITSLLLFIMAVWGCSSDAEVVTEVDVPVDVWARAEVDAPILSNNQEGQNWNIDGSIIVMIAALAAISLVAVVAIFDDVKQRGHVKQLREDPSNDSVILDSWQRGYNYAMHVHSLETKNSEEPENQG